MVYKVRFVEVMTHFETDYFKVLSLFTHYFNLHKMAGAVFGSVELQGVSSGFPARLYEFARKLAIEEGFGRNVMIGGHYVEEDVVSDADTEVSDLIKCIPF